MNVFEALDRAARLQSLGLQVRSPELAGEAQRMREFYATGGNRQMRRAAARGNRRKGR